MITFFLLQNFSLSAMEIGQDDSITITDKTVNRYTTIFELKQQHSVLDLSNTIFKTISALERDDITENISQREYFSNYFRNLNNRLWQIMKVQERSSSYSGSYNINENLVKEINLQWLLLWKNTNSSSKNQIEEFTKNVEDYVESLWIDPNAKPLFWKIDPNEQNEVKASNNSSIIKNYLWDWFMKWGGMEKNEQGVYVEKQTIRTMFGM